MRTPATVIFDMIRTVFQGFLDSDLEEDVFGVDLALAACGVEREELAEKTCEGEVCAGFWR